MQQPGSYLPHGFSGPVPFANQFPAANQLSEVDHNLPAPGVHARKGPIEFDAAYRPTQSPTLTTPSSQVARPSAPGAPSVAPVACPTYVPPAAPPQNRQPAGGQAQQAQHPLTPRMVAAAKHLEQMIPSIQILLSLVHDLAQANQPDTVRELQNALNTAISTHQSALGYIRRFLCGESTPRVARGIGVAVRMLKQQFSGIDHLLETTARGLPATARASLLSLLNQTTAAEAQLDQAVTTVEGALGNRMMS